MENIHVYTIPQLVHVYPLNIYIQMLYLGCSLVSGMS